MKWNCLIGLHAQCRESDCGCPHHKPDVVVALTAEDHALKICTRQRSVAQLVACGFHIPDIARELNVSQQIVKENLCSLYRKFGIPNDGRVCQIVRLAVWMNCELFRIGMKAAA
jgi:DNA-binding NarL/FixJ family response regulator